MKIFFLIPVLIFSFFISGSSGNKKSLIVAEFLKDKTGTGHYTYLTSYNFLDGKLISKDTIFGAEKDNDSIIWFHFRFDIGKNFIYHNRYLVSGCGNVVDIKTKSLVMAASDDFVEAIGDTLLFHRNNIWGGTGYLVLDLKTRSYGFVADQNFRAVKGLQSPDHKHGIDIDESRLQRKIILYDQKNVADTIVADAGRGCLMSPESSSHGKVPVFWIDNSTFVYADYSISNYFEGKPIYTDGYPRPDYLPENLFCNVTIREVNIITKENKCIGKIDSVKQAMLNSKFYYDGDSNIVFIIGLNFYKIDCVNNNITIYKFKNKTENGFEFLNDKNGMVVIKYNQEKIGKLLIGNHFTTEGYFAAEYGPANSNMTYPQGIKVWNNITREWTTIDIPWECALIGWIDN